MKQIKLTDYTVEQLARLVGINEKNIELLEKELEVELIYRFDELIIQSEDSNKIKQVEEIIQALLELVKKGLNIQSRDIVYDIKLKK